MAPFSVFPCPQKRNGCLEKINAVPFEKGEFCNISSRSFLTFHSLSRRLRIVCLKKIREEIPISLLQEVSSRGKYVAFLES